jgi:hypothetical protein
VCRPTGFYGGIEQWATAQSYGGPSWEEAPMMKEWVLWVGMIAALVGSIYLGRIATSEGLVGHYQWSDAGYGVVVD